MQLKDIANMTEYLENDCYCPGEIYDNTGFFFQVFDAEDSCKLLTKGYYKEYDVTAVICKNQIICFFMTKNKISDATRWDATENNVSEIVSLLNGKKTTIKTDTFNNNSSEADLEKIMSIADAIMID